MLDSPMKERLTGAIILVAVLVLLVPELLTGPGRASQSAQSAATADGAQMRSYTINLGDDANASRSSTAPVTETPTPAAPPGSATDAKPAGQVANEASMPASVPANDGADASGADASGAEGAGSANVESATAFADRGVDQTDQSSAAPAMSAEPPAPVVRAEPPKPAPREQPAAARAETLKKTESRPTSGWAIQVGSFASRANADRLARDLKGKGFATTVSSSTSKGKRLWRVRVGPEADRSAAVALGTKLRAAGQSGAVVPYP